MSNDPHKELREAREELRQQWNYGGGADLARAVERERRAQARVSVLEQGQPKRAPIAWPHK
jgi:hypothetical protein